MGSRRQSGRERDIWLRTVACVLFSLSVHSTAYSQAAREQAAAANISTAQEVAARHEIAVAVVEWLAATNARDFEAQKRFYPETMDAFYLWRRVPLSAVLAEKRRVFDHATVIDLKAEAPQIIVDREGRKARTYFRKAYVIEGARDDRAGEVLQELRWVKEPSGWKIVSERDIRVIRESPASERD